MTLAVSIAQSGANNVTMRNRIINGACAIDQYNAGASITPVQSQFVVDRFKVLLSQSNKFTSQQNAGSVTPPTGFKSYIGLTVGASANVTVGASDYFALWQKIEGYNISDLGWGAAGAASVTLSFWVRSSVTGTFGGALQNGEQSRFYPFTYTVSSANTWEQKSITIAGDTTGTWQSTNGAGMTVSWGLGAGSNWSGTAGAWAAQSGSVYPLTATGATNWISNNSATFYITGVQLEKGSTATSFDYRPYTTELALCQRYFEVLYGSVGAYAALGLASVTNSTVVKGPVLTYNVTKRASPTITPTGNFAVLTGGSLSSIAFNSVDINTSFATADIGGSGFTTGQSITIRNNNDTSAKITAESEL